MDMRQTRSISGQSNELATVIAGAHFVELTVALVRGQRRRHVKDCVYVVPRSV